MLSCPIHGRGRVADDGTLLDRCPVCLVEAKDAIDLIQAERVAVATAWAEAVLARTYGPDWRTILDDSRRRRLRAVS